MVRIIAYIRPHRLEEVKSALAMLPISGLTVSDTRGCGNNPETTSSFFGQEIVISLPIRSKVEVVVPANLQEAVVSAICDAARTGEPGDGKVFIEPVTDSVRIRTLERGETVL